ncbi:Balbiani ring protein [Dirofilaria immitis]
MLATIIAIILLSTEIEIRYSHNRYESTNNSFFIHSNKTNRSDAEADSTWYERNLIKSELKSHVLNDQIIDNETRYNDAVTKIPTALPSNNINQQHQILRIQPLLSNFSQRNKQQFSMRVTPISLYPSVSQKIERAKSFILPLSRLLRSQIPSSFTTPDKQIVSSSISIASKSRNLSSVTSQKSAVNKRKRRDNIRITLINEVTVKTKKLNEVSDDRRKVHTISAMKQEISTPKILKKTTPKFIDFGKGGVIKTHYPIKTDKPTNYLVKTGKPTKPIAMIKTSKHTKPTTMIKSTKHTKPTIMPTKANLFLQKKSKKTTNVTTIRSHSTIISYMPRKTTTNSKVLVTRQSGGKGGLIGCVIGGIIVFLISGAIFGFIYYRKMTKDLTKSQKKKDEGESGIVPVVLPQVLNTTPDVINAQQWAPDVINAQQFQYKGPLNLYISHPTDLKHDMENLAVESPKADDHIIFDDTLNQWCKLMKFFCSKLYAMDKNINYI